MGQRAEGGAARTPVAVLLSTFNGAAFLEAQIASILGQTWPAVQLLIRDGGSTDGTWDIIQKWRRNPRVVAVRGPNIGAAASSLAMLGLVDPSAEFVAFADQGGVWHAEKIARGVARLSAAGGARPALYCSRGWISGQEFAASPATPRWPRPPCFGNALVENIAIGGGVILDRAAVSLLRGAGAPQGASDHAWWSYLVVAAFGSVIFDPRPSLHLSRRPLSARAGLGAIVAQARSFLAYFGAHPWLRDADRGMAEALAHGSAFGRRALAADRRLGCQFARDDIRLRLQMLAGPWPELARAERPSGAAAAHRS